MEISEKKTAIKSLEGNIHDKDRIIETQRDQIMRTQGELNANKQELNGERQRSRSVQNHLREKEFEMSDLQHRMDVGGSST